MTAADDARLFAALDCLAVADREAARGGSSIPPAVANHSLDWKPGETARQHEARVAVALGSTDPAVVEVARQSPHFRGPR